VKNLFLGSLEATKFSGEENGEIGKQTVQLPDRSLLGTEHSRGDTKRVTDPVEWSSGVR
jgi:hypothetical protein